MTFYILLVIQTWMVQRNSRRRPHSWLRANLKLRKKSIIVELRTCYQHDSQSRLCRLVCREAEQTREGREGKQEEEEEVEAEGDAGRDVGVGGFGGFGGVEAERDKSDLGEVNEARASEIDRSMERPIHPGWYLGSASHIPWIGLC